MSDSHPIPASEVPAAEPSEGPRFRPREQFWPYADLEEEPSDEELSRIDPNLQDALYDRPVARPFSYTVVFGPFDGADYDRAVTLARQTADYVETGHGGQQRHRARFRPDQVVELRDLWQLVGGVASADVLVDDRPVPYARELWLPLLWYLIR